MKFYDLKFGMLLILFSVYYDIIDELFEFS